MIFAGLVVSVSLASAFLGCALSGTIADVVGRRRAFQISSVPMILGSIIRYTHSSLETCSVIVIVSILFFVDMEFQIAPAVPEKYIMFGINTGLIVEALVM